MSCIVITLFGFWLTDWFHHSEWYDRQEVQVHNGSTETSTQLQVQGKCSCTVSVTSLCYNYIWYKGAKAFAIWQLMQGLIVFSFVYWKFCFDFILLEGGGCLFCFCFFVGGRGEVEGSWLNVINIKTSYILSVLTPTALRHTGR